MSAETKKEIELEIAHVLFIDIVGYSKLLIDEQRDCLHTLNEVVRATDSFRAADAAGKLTRLPTGDGMALVFATTPDAPVVCALQIAKALQSHPDLRARMGIHSGPVSGVVDVNERANVAGAGINMAQRVMDCGEAGHILLSKRVADDLEQYRQWREHLHDLGECEVKHGVRVHVVNLYTDVLGNPEAPQKFKQRTPAPSATADSRPRSWSKPARIAFLVVAALALAAGIAFFSRHRSATQPNEKSIAVLPFENRSRDPDNAYFAEGIQDEILARLAKVSDLKVISRTSTQRFKSAPGDLRRIAQQLGVANILEGSVQKSDDQVRVNVQLINATTDTHLWAEIYDRKLTDVFGVESEIASKIAQTLQAKLSGAEQKAIAARPTQNTEAHQAYLKGLYYWNRRGEGGLTKATEYFKQAIEADQNYALAYTGLADSYALLGFHGYGALPPKEAIPKAKAAAEKALQIDEMLGEAHASLAWIKEEYDWDVAGAEKEYKRALELNPGYATAHQWYAHHLSLRKRHPDALAEIKLAQELDPLSLVINMNVGWVFYFARQYDEAVEQCQKTLELDPNYFGAHWQLGQAYREKGMYEEAIAEFQKGLSLSERDPIQIAVLGHAYAVAGKRDEAQKIISELQEISKRRYFPPYFIALIYVGLGEKNQAFAWLEKAFAERSALTVLKAEPMFDPLRSDARFQDLLRRVGLTP